MRLLQVFNLGYDASKSAVPKNGYAVHHPAGNFARISMFNSTACAPKNLSLLMSFPQFFISPMYTSACLLCCVIEFKLFARSCCPQRAVCGHRDPLSRHIASGAAFLVWFIAIWRWRSRDGLRRR